MNYFITCFLVGVKDNVWQGIWCSIHEAMIKHGLTVRFSWSWFWSLSFCRGSRGFSCGISSSATRRARNISRSCLRKFLGVHRCLRKPIARTLLYLIVQRYIEGACIIMMTGHWSPALSWFIPETAVAPPRVILANAGIQSKRALALNIGLIKHNHLFGERCFMNLTAQENMP